MDYFCVVFVVVFFFQAEDGIRDHCVTGVQTCALPISRTARTAAERAGYLRGAFQGAGSVNWPGGRGGHHLEFVHREEEFIRRCVNFSRAPLKVVRRRGRWVAYTKSADGVTTILAQMGLNDAVLEYE